MIFTECVYIGVVHDIDVGIGKGTCRSVSSGVLHNIGVGGIEA